MDIDAGAIGWIVRTSIEQYWRVCEYCEVEDLIQDGLTHYVRIVQKYPDVTAPAHLMRLFQTTFYNHLHDLAERHDRQRFEFAADIALARGCGETEIWDDLMGQDGERQTLFVKLTQAPAIVQQLLKLLGSAEGCERWRRPYRRRLGGFKETRNERWSVMVGSDDVLDLSAMLRRAILVD